MNFHFKRPFAFSILSVALLVTNWTFAQNQDTASGSIQADASISTVSQGFSLFEGIEESANARSRSRNRANRESRVSSAGPEFILRGTSRIGDSYSVILQDRAGESFLLKTKPNNITVIPDHEGYAVVDVDAGKISIRFPANVPCVAARESGVSCSASGNIAELALSTGEPVVINVVEPAEEQPEETIVNPFEALRSDTAGARREGRFTPRRISPDDVPPGMRVVSTPFGDRLVEQ